MTRLPTISMTATKAATLAAVSPSASAISLTLAPVALQQPGDDRQQDQRQHHGEVLDDQPADGDPPALGLDQAPLLQSAQQHHGAGHRQRQAEHQPGADRPAQPRREPHAEQGGAGDLDDGAGDGDLLDREQILEREVQADAEHQENDADLGELAGEILVGDDSRA